MNRKFLVVIVLTVSAVVFINIFNQRNFADEKKIDKIFKINLMEIQQKNFQKDKKIAQDEINNYAKMNPMKSIMPNLKILGTPVAHQGTYELSTYLPNDYSIICNDICSYSLNGHLWESDFEYLELNKSSYIWKNTKATFEGNVDIYDKNDVITIPKDNVYTQGKYIVGSDIPVGEYFSKGSSCSASIDSGNLYSGKENYINVKEGDKAVYVSDEGSISGATECELVPIDEVWLPKGESNVYTMGKVGRDLKPGLYRSYSQEDYSKPGKVHIYSSNGETRVKKSRYVKLEDGDFFMLNSPGYLKPALSI